MVLVLIFNCKEVYICLVVFIVFREGLGVGEVGGFECMCVNQGAAKKLHVCKLFFFGFH